MKRKLGEEEVVGFVLPGEGHDEHKFATLRDPDAIKIAQKLKEFQIESSESTKDSCLGFNTPTKKAKHAEDLILNFWALVSSQGDCDDDDFKMEEMEQAFGKEFWKKDWKIYELSDLPCKEFPLIFSSFDWA